MVDMAISLGRKIDNDDLSLNKIGEPEAISISKDPIFQNKMLNRHLLIVGLSFSKEEKKVVFDPPM